MATNVTTTGGSGREGQPDRQRRRKMIVAGHIGVLAATAVSAVFITAFIGGLHDPGPRSVPIGVVGAHAQASKVRTELNAHAPGAFTVASYRTVAAARTAIYDRSIDAALAPGTTVQHLLVA